MNCEWIGDELGMNWGVDYHHGGVNSAISRGADPERGYRFSHWNPSGVEVRFRSRSTAIFSPRARLFWNSEIRGDTGLCPPSMGSVSNGVCCVWFDCAMDIPNNAIALVKRPALYLPRDFSTAALVYQIQY